MKCKFPRIAPLLLTTLLLSCYESNHHTEDGLATGFKNPPVSARPKALWPWVNGNFSLPAITYELEQAKEKGMGGFDIWDVGTNMNPGGIVPDGPAFLSDESVDAIAHVIRVADRLGLEIGLITSSSWNAGGQWIQPEHGAMGLFRSDTVVTGPASFHALPDFPLIPEKYGNHENIMNRGEDGLLVHYTEVGILAHLLTSDSLLQSDEIFYLGKPKDNSTPVTWNVPEGNWRIVRYVCAPTGQPLMIPSTNSNGLMLDHFSSEAQEANMNHIISRLKTKLPELSNRSLKYFYEDSYEVNTAVWTTLLPEAFEKKRGYAITNYLPALDGFTIDNRDITERFYFDFTKLLSDLIIENHYQKGREICEREGLGFHAEAGGPGQPIHNVPFEDLKALGSLTVPRGEFWNKHPQLEKLQIVKGISSAAHIYDQTYVEAEAFTSVWLWQEGPNELKPLADRAMCEGLNRFVYHTFPHTTPEAGAPGWIYNFGTIINTTNGWWPLSKGFHEYLARCSYLLQQGNFHGDVAFYYGDEAPNFVPPKHTPTSLGKGYDYDVVNTDVILNKMSVKDGKIFLPHGQYYEVLVLPPDSRINPEVLKKLEHLVKEGAIIIGDKPRRSYALHNHQENDKQIQELAGKIWGEVSDGKKESLYGKGKVVWGKSVREVLLEKEITPDVQFISNKTHDSLDYIHRYTEEADIYFIRNTSKNTLAGTVTFRVNNKQPEWWDPKTAETFSIPCFERASGGISLPVTLKGEESAFIVFRKTQKGSAPCHVENVYYTEHGAATQIFEETPPVLRISTPWEVRFQHQGNSPVSTHFPSLASWHTSTEEGIKFFSGTAIYTNQFTIESSHMSDEHIALLELNAIKEIAEVYLNGERLGYHWHHSNHFNITDKLKSDVNTLTIVVVNTINNALVGDAQRPEAYRSFRSNISKLPNAWRSPFAEAPLIEAGLLGPVEIRWLKKI